MLEWFNVDSIPYSRWIGRYWFLKKEGGSSDSWLCSAVLLRKQLAWPNALAMRIWILMVGWKAPLDFLKQCSKSAVNHPSPLLTTTKALCDHVSDQGFCHSPRPNQSGDPLLHNCGPSPLQSHLRLPFLWITINLWMLDVHDCPRYWIIPLLSLISHHNLYAFWLKYPESEDENSNSGNKQTCLNSWIGTKETPP